MYDHAQHFLRDLFLLCHAFHTDKRIAHGFERRSSTLQHNIYFSHAIVICSHLTTVFSFRLLRLYIFSAHIAPQYVCWFQNVWSRRAVKTLFTFCVARDFSFSFIYGLKCDQKKLFEIWSRNYQKM